MVYLVFGSPCSGKTTYIKEHMKENDILCDVDFLYSAIGNNDSHDADLWVHETALKLREYLFDIVQERDGGWTDAYVVSTANTWPKVKEDMDRVKADECIFIDTPYSVCMARASERPDYFKLLIDEWFQTTDFKGGANGK